MLILKESACVLVLALIVSAVQGNPAAANSGSQGLDGGGES